LPLALHVVRCVTDSHDKKIIENNKKQGVIHQSH
jgi:hypothetical protein